jgi:hypothetical protein
MRNIPTLLASCVLLACAGDEGRTPDTDRDLEDLGEVSLDVEPEVEVSVGVGCLGLEGRPEWPWPLRLRASVGSTHAQFDWWDGGFTYDLEAWMDENRIVGFGLFAAEACEPTMTVTMPQWTFVLGTLEPDTHYRFRVEALDEEGRWSNDGPEVAFKTECATYWEDFCPPTWPTGATMAGTYVGDDSLDLTWTAANDNQDEVWYRLLADGQIVDPQNTIPMTDYTTRTPTHRVTGLTPGIQYRFEVLARDNKGPAGPTWVPGPKLDVLFMSE